MVKAGGSLADPRTQEHIRDSIEAGFNALWIYSHEAGRWTAQDAPLVPFLFPEFKKTARWCRDHGVRIAVSVSPIADSRGDFVFHDRVDERRIRRFLQLARREGVRDFVLSFDDVSTELTDLDDVLRYGLDAAPAHVELTSRIERSFRHRDRVWVCGSVYCNAQLESLAPYARAFVRRVQRLPRRIGIVWTGPDIFSESISEADLAAVRARFGGRPLLLYDNYPANDDTLPGHALGLIMGPLRRRDSALSSQVAAYLACPMYQLGASRLPLLTIADYLRHPRTYDPDASWRRAILRLAGEDPAARRALYDQATEWGGWIGEPHYQEIDRENPEAAADLLLETGEPQRWSSTVSTYPDRMAALSSLQDRAFRTDLLAAMARRLAVARAAPIARRYFESAESSDAEKTDCVDDLRRLRTALERDPEGARALDAFVEAAGIPWTTTAPSEAAAQ